MLLEVPNPDVKPEDKPEDKPEEKPNADPPKTFTQAEVDAMIQQRQTDAQAEADRLRDEENGNFKTLYEQEKAAREQDKADREAAEQNTKIRSAVEVAATDKALRAREPKAVAALVDASKLKLDGDKVKGIEAEIERIKKEFPGMFHTPGNQNGGRSNAVTTDEASTPRERLRNAYANK